MALALAAQFCLAQGARFEWARATSGSFGFGPQAITADAEGCLYAIGYFRDSLSFSGGLGSTAIASAGEADVFIAKISPAGSLIWAKRIGGDQNDYGFSVAVDAQGQVYAAGFFEGTADFDPGPDSFLLSSAGLFDAFILKLDAEGEFLWAKSIQGDNNIMAYAICADEAGSVYATGWFADTPDFDPGPGSSSLTSVGLADVFVLKLDGEGNFLWAKSFGGDSSDEGGSIGLDAAGNVYTAGWFYGTADFNPGAQPAVLTSQGERDLFIQKMDSDGGFLWARAFGGPRDDYGYAIYAVGNEQVYVAGSFFDSMALGALGTLSSSGGADAFVLKLDGGGSILWAKTMGGPSEDEARSVWADAAGAVYVAGYFRGEADFGPASLTSAGSWDIFAHKLDRDGNSQWAESFGGSDNDKAFSACLDTSGDYYLSGFFEGTVDFDPPSGSAVFSTDTPQGVIIKMSQDKTNPTHSLPQRDSLRLYPNPTRDVFNIDLGDHYQNISLKINDAKGKLIYQNHYQGQRHLQFSLPGLAPGVYFIEAVTENKVLAGKLAVQE